MKKPTTKEINAQTTKRDKILARLLTLPEPSQVLFKKMYSHEYTTDEHGASSTTPDSVPDLGKPIDHVIADMPADLLDHALQHVENIYQPKTAAVGDLDPIAQLTPLAEGSARDSVLIAIDKARAANRNCVVLKFDKATREARVGLLTNEGEPCEVAVVALPNDDTRLVEGDIVSVKGSVKGKTIVDAGYVGRSQALMPDSLSA